MSGSATPSSLKRRKPEPNSNDSLGDADRVVLGTVKNTKNMGLWSREIKWNTNLAENVITKSLKSLLSNKLIKEVVNIQNKGRKHYMAAEFEPSEEVTGGSWYVEGKLDNELIDILKGLCLKIIGAEKVSTVDRIYGFLKKQKVTTFECTEQQIGEILNKMLLDNEIIEVKSTG